MAFFTKEIETDVEDEQPVTPRMPIEVIPATPPPPRGANMRVAANANGGISSDQQAYLANGCTVSGKLGFEGPAQIDGRVDGEINAKSTLMVGESAIVKAQIKAASIVVAGTVEGEIVASQRIEIGPSARVTGNLTAPKVVIREGAIFEGNCAMRQDNARVERKSLGSDERALTQSDHKKAS